MSTLRPEATLFTPPGAERSPLPVAVIDIGTSAIRMAIGEIRPDGTIRTLETLTQSVAVGKDVFTRGHITRATIEDCVRVLIRYREVLDAYGITSPTQLRCVATSAVRESQNTLAFLDRVYIATGIQVEPLDAAEISRMMYLGVQPTLRSDPTLAHSRAIVIEVGGGSTELLVVENGQVLFSHTYNLGSMRLRQTMESLHAPVHKERELMENHIDRFIAIALQHVPTDETMKTELIALGGDLRFAAGQLVPDRVEETLAPIAMDVFSDFVGRMFSLSDDEIVHDFHLTYPDAETLGPALVAVERFARSLKVDCLRVSTVNLRDGMLQDMARQGVWIDDFREQVINSAVELGLKFGFDQRHAEHVATLCSRLFESLQPLHRLDERYSVMLQLAALLHEIGLYVGISSYHKHSMYLIQHSELFGLSRRDLLIVSMIARYHRRASPKPTHSQFSSLRREDRIIVAKLASILRVADAMDRSYSQRIKEFTCHIEKGRLIVAVPDVEDLSLEQIALKQSAQMFEETYGRTVLLRRSRL